MITNLDELKRKHDWARIARAGSREWIEFATAMLDSFPALYETAKVMNAHLAAASLDKVRLDWLQEQAESGCVEMCFEIDGGVHVTVSECGGEERAAREVSTVRAGIDQLINLTQGETNESNAHHS